jgi:hypothetical protein
MQHFLQTILNKLPPEAKHQVQKALFMLREKGLPLLVAAFKKILALQEGVASGGTGKTLASYFKHILVVGLNRSELNAAGESNAIFNDNWQDLISENMRRHMALVFFAPRGLDGEPINPHLFLTGEMGDDGTRAEGTAEANQALAEQVLQGVGLLDYCRISPAVPNTVNMVLAADVLFHWDVKDSYVLPTSPTTWVRDVEQVIKSYPRTTKVQLYTTWNTDILTPSDKLKIFALKDLPLDEQAWLNQPTVQEKYAGHVLTTAIIAAVLTFSGLWFKQGRIDDLNDQLRMIEQQIPGEGRLSELERGITEQERMQKMREVFFLSVKDAARAIARAEMKTASFEVKTPDPATPPKQLILTLEAEKGAYNGWMEEEPIARSVLVNSALLRAVRKLPGTGYKLEGLVNLTDVYKQFTKLAPQGGALAAGRVMGKTAPAEQVAP